MHLYLIISRYKAKPCNVFEGGSASPKSLEVDGGRASLICVPSRRLEVSQASG